MKREEFKPVDLGHLQEKAVSIVHAFKESHNHDRSDEYRKFHLKRAEDISKTLLSDFGYYMDKYSIGGIVPYGLDQKN